MKDMTNDGILAIWHDVDAAIGDDYERWYFREHLPERVGVPGFVAGRRYEAVEGAPKFLTYYEGKSPDVFISKPYLDRLNDPTPWTTSVLRYFRDTNRTICRRTWETGSIRGGWGVVFRINRSGDGEDEAAAGRVAALEEQGRGWAEDWRVLRVELWRREALPLPGKTAEAGLRAAPDRFIEGAVLAHFAREEDARSAAESAGAPCGGAEAGVYRLLCELRSD